MLRRFVLVVLAAAVFAAACAKEPPRPAGQQPPVDVAAAKAVIADVPDTTPAVGTVESRHAATLSAKVMGVIREVWAEEGDSVGRGKVLVTIDDADIRARRQEAAQSKAEGEAALKEAKAALENARVNLGRFTELYREQAVTKKELDDVATQEKMAGARVERAEARIAQADAAVAQADVMLGYTVIRSPISGVVTAKDASAGEMAAPGRPLLTVADDSDLRLSTTVKEGEVQYVHKGEELTVKVDALVGLELAGRVADIVPAADPATRSFTVKVGLRRAPGLMPGMFARAMLPVGMRKAVLAPAGAVFGREGVQGVLVVGPDNTVRFQAVRTGDELEGKKEIISGLSGGELVVVGGGMEKLSDGAKVRVTTER